METSKRSSAKSQIEAAIEHFQNGKLDCAITLSAAAEGMVPQTEGPHIFKRLQEDPQNKEMNYNRVINWLKHSGEQDSATISEFEATVIVARAITKFVAHYRVLCDSFNGFLRWGHEAGHLPRLHRE